MEITGTGKLPCFSGLSKLFTQSYLFERFLYNLVSFIKNYPNISDMLGSIQKRVVENFFEYASTPKFF